MIQFSPISHYSGPHIFLSTLFAYTPVWVRQSFTPIQNRQVRVLYILILKVLDRWRIDWTFRETGW